jgi:hypothetical protein
MVYFLGLPHAPKINDLSLDSLHTLDEIEEITGWKDDDDIDNADILSIDDIGTVKSCHYCFAKEKLYYTSIEDPEEIDLNPDVISSKSQSDTAEIQNFKVGENPVSLWCVKGAHVSRYVAAGISIH